jgi:hypothetical protein
MGPLPPTKAKKKGDDVSPPVIVILPPVAYGRQREGSGLERNDDLRTEDSGRKASDATADDNNSLAISAARMS